MTRRHLHSTLAAFALLTLACGTARADVYRTIEAIRNEGCGITPASFEVDPLWRDASLGRVAIELANGRKLPEALEQAGYQAASARSFHIRGASDDTAVRLKLRQTEYCEQVVDARYTEMNWFQRGDETWIVLAAPRLPTPPPDLDPAAVAPRILELVNAARAEARTCGDDFHEAAAPLTLSTLLSEVARAHANDLAARKRLDHVGSDGSTVGERYARAGYAWSAAEENLAAGQRDADAVVAAWLEGPVQCAKLMAPTYTEMGIAFAFPALGSNPSIYWVQSFAAPR